MARSRAKKAHTYTRARALVSERKQYQSFFPDGSIFFEGFLLQGLFPRDYSQRASFFVRDTRCMRGFRCVIPNDNALSMCMNNHAPSHPGYQRCSRIPEFFIPFRVIQFITMQILRYPIYQIKMSFTLSSIRKRKSKIIKLPIYILQNQYRKWENFSER